MGEREWWEPVLVDAALAKRLRKDYGHGPGVSDEQLFEHYGYHSKYATTWDHVGDAYAQFEPLADAYTRLLRIEAAARAVTDSCMPRERDKAIEALRAALGSLREGG